MNSSKAFGILRRLVLWVLLAFVALPLILVLARSFENPVSVAQGSMAAFVWKHFSAVQYRQVLFHNLDYWNGFWNTVILALPAIFLTQLTATLAAYGLTRMKEKSKRPILLYYIVLSLLPVQVLLVPNFVMLSSMKLIGSRAAVVLSCCFSPYYTYFLFRFCSQIPPETFEAARMEGAGELQVYGRIALPQMKHGILTLLLIGGADFWNMVEQPLAFLQDPSKYPLSVLFKDIDLSMQYAGSVIFSIPLLMLFFFYRNDFVRGIHS